MPNTNNKQHFIEDDLMIVSKQTMDLLLKQENPADLIALYNFYYYTAKWQKTNQPKASVGYVAKGLHWGKDKVIKAKQALEKLGLISTVRDIDKETKKVKGWYVRLNYIWSQHRPHSSEPESGFQDSNALSADNKNTFSKENGEPSNNKIHKNVDKSVDKLTPMASIIGNMKQKFRTEKQDLRINQRFQAYAHEVVVEAGFKNGGRARIFQAFKSKNWGYSQAEKAKKVISSDLFRALKTEDSKTRYLIGALSKI